MTKAQTRLSRRHFLLAATAGTAASAAAVVVGKQQTQKTGAEDTAQPAGKGYQATEHVNNYYRTARI